MSLEYEPASEPPRSPPVYMTVVSDSHYQSTLDAVYVYVVPWSEFPIVPSYPHYPHRCRAKREHLGRVYGLLPESQGRNLALKAKAGIWP